MAAPATAALAAQKDVRETSFFRHDLYHFDGDFSELAYKHIEAKPILEKFEQIRGLMDDAANAAEVGRMFWEADDQLLELAAMVMLLSIRSYMDIYDEETAAAFAGDMQTCAILDDAVSVLTWDILNSPPCAAFLKEVLSEDQLRKCLEYGEMDPDLAELTARENELQSKAGAYAFWDAAQSDYFDAADKYLRFMALGFQAGFEAVGMDSPVSEGYLKELSGVLSEKLGLSEGKDGAAAGSPDPDAIRWATENGVAGTSFAPDEPCTRAEAVPFLWRAMGSPAPSSAEDPFTDVDESSPYYEAVLWAAENGVTRGVTATTFAPDAVCTRAQAVTFQWRAAGQPAASVSAGFDDVDASGRLRRRGRMGRRARRCRRHWRYRLLP